MNLKTFSSEDKIAYLIKPILKVLQEAGGQLERSEIKERIADMDDQIAEYSVLEKKSKKTGNTYKEFNFKFMLFLYDCRYVIFAKTFKAPKSQLYQGFSAPRNSRLFFGGCGIKPSNRHVVR